MPPDHPITAVLGPTNTGKTHRALERMMAHHSGIIGFPLRLLARENYDRVVAAKGADAVALITGEEKILPPRARYFLCTVESMPVDRQAAFLAVDEIQLCADPDRGHVFTDRLLRARGTEETMVMGAGTIAPLIRQLVPDAVIDTRPRFSNLRYAGAAKVTRLPRRSAVVAFSAADVYALAELIRRQRGGAAVVLGALSPRTRNAQVGMYQAGEVDYLVATDAIGMGLNMDIDHVAFASLRKFDGRHSRGLTAAELGQIAGRAGRHMNDGTFGTTADAPAMEADMIDRLEQHQFQNLRTVNWRNPDLSFVSVEALLARLDRQPEKPGLLRTRMADDHRALVALWNEPEILAMAKGTDAVRLLWEVCRVPDFRKAMGESHLQLLSRLYRHLMAPGGLLPEDWVTGQVNRIDRYDGDIDTLVQRLAHIRTWTYIAYRGDWLRDPGHWQARARAIEDKLSDALHERLTKRFVDQRTSVLMRRLRAGDGLEAEVDDTGEVSVEGHFVGHLHGFRFAADSAETRNAARAVSGAARKALRSEINSRLEALEAETNPAALTLDGQGWILWRDAPVARLIAGPEVLRPAVDALSSDLLSPADRDRIQAFLATWTDQYLRRELSPLFDLRDAPLSGAAKGIAFQLGEALGSLPRAGLTAQIDALSRDDRRALRAQGVRIARDSVFMPHLLRPASARLRAVLWCTHRGVSPVPLPPKDGRSSVPLTAADDPAFLEAIGYRPIGGLAIRLEILERVTEMAWEATKKGAADLTPAMMNLVGCGAPQLGAALRALGYKVVLDAETNAPRAFARQRKKPVKQAERPKNAPAQKRKRPAKPSKPNPDSPFAGLREMMNNR
ncbi:MAG: helicase-related protein [Magnetospiraceae bacterium]